MRQPTPDRRHAEADDTETALLRPVVAAIVRVIHPLAIVRFGSRARGDQRETSDVDLLIVVPEGVTTRQVCAALDQHRALAATPHGIDLVAATPARLLAARGDYSSVLHWAQEDGVVLYQAPSSPEPTASQGRDGLPT